MNKDFYNPKQNYNDDEVDVIRLLNYFKNGIKSFFRFLWRLIEVIIQFIVLLKKNWIIVGVLTLGGAIYGWYLQQNKEIKTYEMVVRTNPFSNIELYAFSEEVNSQNKFSPKIETEGITLAKNLGIGSVKIEPIEKTENVISSYFNQIDGSPLRADQTDTIYYLAFQINEHKSNMDEFDYNIQRIQFNVQKDISPDKIQDDFLKYMNNVPGVKREQESKLAILNSYENVIKRTLSNIDSLLVSKAVANKGTNGGGSEQLLVNTASRGTIEGDLLRYAEIFSKKLYGTQKEISEHQMGVNIVSNLRLISNDKILNNPLIKYTILGFILASLIVLLIQFNKYLNRFSAERNL